MNPPARSLREESREAIVQAIRERGPEAVGIVLIGGARLVLALAVLLVLHFFGAALFGFSLVSVPLAAVSVLSVALSVMATLGHRWGAQEDGAPTRDEALDGSR